MEVDDDEGGADETEIPVETYEAFAARIDDFVRSQIEKSMGLSDVKGEGSGGKGRDGYKDGLVYAERKTVLRDFGRKVYNKCSCCGA